jgi:hypothetical protein
VIKSGDRHSRIRAAVSKLSVSSNSQEEYEEDDSSDEENGFAKADEKSSKSAPRIGENEMDYDEIKRANSARIQVRRHK